MDTYNLFVHRKTAKRLKCYLFPDITPWELWRHRAVIARQVVNEIESHRNDLAYQKPGQSLLVFYTRRIELVIHHLEKPYWNGWSRVWYGIRFTMYVNRQFMASNKFHVVLES